MRSATRSLSFTCERQEEKRMMEEVWQRKGCAHPLYFLGWKRASQVNNQGLKWFSYKGASLAFRKGRKHRPCDGKLKALMARIRRNYGKC